MVLIEVMISIMIVTLITDGLGATHRQFQQDKVNKKCNFRKKENQQTAIINKDRFKTCHFRATSKQNMFRNNCHAIAMPLMCHCQASATPLPRRTTPWGVEAPGFPMHQHCRATRVFSRHEP